MTGREIVQLLIRLGPIAFDWLLELHAIWNKELTVEELEAFVKSHRKSYDDYIANERSRRIES